MSLPRKLAFKDKFVYRLIQEIDETLCSGDPIQFPDDTTPIKFVVELSQNEFTKLYAAVLTGADLSYPDEAHDVSWILLRQLECPVSLCDELTECLEPLFEAIATQITTMGEALSEQIGEATEVIEPVPVAIEDCNLAKAYNGCVSVVETINDTIMDIYERAEAEAPDILTEFTDIVLSAIPVFETLPIDELFELANWLFENQVEDYTADYTEVWRDEAACMLFCYVQDDCELSHEDLTAWLLALETAYPTNLAAQIFTRFGAATGEGLAQQIGQAINTVRGGMSITAFFDRLLVQYGIGGQIENSGYLLCPVCEWEEITDVALDLNVDKWTIDPDDGELVPGLYFQSTLHTFYPPGNTYRAIALSRTVPSGSILTEWEVEGEYVQGDVTVLGDVAFQFIWGSHNYTIPLPTQPVLPEGETGLSDAGGAVSLAMVAGVNGESPVDPGGYARITRITLRGTGAPPA